VPVPYALDLGDSTNGIPPRDGATMQIKDGGFLIISMDSNNDGTINDADNDPLVKNHFSHPGHVMLVNADDDNKNGQEDRLDRHVDFDIPTNNLALQGSGTSVTVANENDLAAVHMYVSVVSLEPKDANTPETEIDVYFTVHNNAILWTAPTKGRRLHQGEIASGRVLVERRLATLDANTKTFSRTFHLEGVQPIGVGNISLHARPTSGTAGQDSARFMSILADLDIDSDNTGILAGPGRTIQEEFFEDHPFALGKILYLNPSNANMNFTPIIVDLPNSVVWDTLELSFDYKSSGLANSSGDNLMRLWRKDGHQPRNASDFIPSSTRFPISHFDRQPGATYLILYVEGVAETSISTPTLARANGKPDARIKVQYHIPGASNSPALTDDVLAVVASYGSFYYELWKHSEGPALHAVYAARAIYERESPKEYCLELQSAPQLENLGLSGDVLTWLSGGTHNGLDAGLYREYITGKYILAFAGTTFPDDANKWEDTIANVRQAWGESVDQYEHAIEIGDVFREKDNLNGGKSYITGHSLGGGLASAAAIASGFTTYTFNSAGLHPNTITGNAPITNYKVRQDILSWGQGSADWLRFVLGDHVPNTPGTTIWIDSTMYWSMAFTQGVTLGSFSIAAVSAVSGQYHITVPAAITGATGAKWALDIGIECHKTPQCIYGMEKHIFGTAVLIE